MIRDKDAAWARKVDVSGWLMDSPNTPLSYFIECLATRGLPQETAAIALHRRIKRSPVGKGPESVHIDAEDWKACLTERDLL